MTVGVLEVNYSFYLSRILDLIVYNLLFLFGNLILEIIDHGH